MSRTGIIYIQISQHQSNLSFLTLVTNYAKQTINISNQWQSADMINKKIVNSNSPYNKIEKIRLVIPTLPSKVGFR